jgi:flavin-dependent dehydrogenase
MIEAEVLIVGGGPAGSSCAWRLREHGIESAVLDAHEFPRVKLCAGWITPKVLADLAIEPGEYPHSLVELGTLNAELFGRRRSWRASVHTGQYSIRRFEFDHWLLARSRAPVFTHPVREIAVVDGGFVVDGRFRGRYLVGAGGTHCPVYRALFREESGRSREYQVAALEQEFPYPARSDACHLWFGENGLVGYSWCVPKGNGWVNVGLGGFCRYLDEAAVKLQEHWAAFTDKLSELGLVRDHVYAPKGHTYYVRDRVRAAQAGNAFLVGDAAGLATRDLGEGIGPAVESGIRAADAIAGRARYSLEGLTTYSLFGGLAARCALGVDRRGLLFRDWVYARGWRAKERAFRSRRREGAALRSA